MAELSLEIPKNWVDETWQKIGGLQDEKKAAKLAQSFTKKQPALAKFILTFTQDLSSEAHELAYYVGLVVWRCYESYFKGKLCKITRDEVIAQYEKMETWLDELEKTEERFLAKRILNKADYKQKHVLQYIVEAIFESRGENVNLTENEEGLLFMVLKVHMDCLDSSVRN